MENSDSGERRSGFAAFWTTLPGVLTGLAALITALLGLYAIAAGGDGDNSRAPAIKQSDGSGTASLPAAGDTSGVGQPSQDPTEEDSEADAGGAGRDGRITMRSPDEADLEMGRVGPGMDGGDLYLYCINPDWCQLSSSGRPMATVEGPVDRSGCVTALDARREGVLETADLQEGTWFCVQTDQAQLVLIEIASAPGVGTADLVLDYRLLD